MSRGKQSPLKRSHRVSLPKLPNDGKIEWKYFVDNEFPLRQTFNYGDQRESELLIRALVNKAISFPVEPEQDLYDYWMEAGYSIKFTLKSNRMYRLLDCPSNLIPFDYYLYPGSPDKNEWDKNIKPFLQTHLPDSLVYNVPPQYLVLLHAIIPPENFQNYLKEFNEKVKKDQVKSARNLLDPSTTVDETEAFKLLHIRCAEWANKFRLKRLDEVKKALIGEFGDVNGEKFYNIYRHALLKNEAKGEPLTLFPVVNRLDPTLYYHWASQLAPILSAKKILDLDKLDDILATDAQNGAKQIKGRGRDAKELDIIRYEMMLQALKSGLETIKR